MSHHNGIDMLEAEMKDRVAAKDRTIAALYDEIETMKEQRSDLLDRLEKLEEVAMRTRDAVRYDCLDPMYHTTQKIKEALSKLEEETV